MPLRAPFVVHQLVSFRIVLFGTILKSLDTFLNYQANSEHIQYFLVWFFPELQLWGTQIGSVRKNEGCLYYSNSLGRMFVRHVDNSSNKSDYLLSMALIM